MFITTNRVVAGLFILLLAGAAFFSLERVLFADASFILFRILNQGSLQIQEHRYGAFVTQGIPLLAAELHLPLKTIVVLYSVSFNLFYLAVVLLLLYRFKQTSLAVLMALYQLLFVSDTWFWMNNEVHQGVAWMFLFFAVVLAAGKQTMHWLAMLALFLPLAFLALFTHPLLLFPTAFLWLFFITKTDWPHSRLRTTIFSLLLLVLAAWKLWLSTGSTSHYDVEKLLPVRNLSSDSIAQAFRSPLVNEIRQRMVWNYWLVPVLFLTGIAGALRQRAYWHALLPVAFAVAYFIALCLIFKDFLPFYTESELMPATIIVTAPFVYYVLPQWRPQQVVLLLTFVFVVRLAYIGAAAPRWVERKEWIMKTLDTMQERQIAKGLVPETASVREKLFLTWGTPVESFLASALRSETPQRTFVVANKENLQKRTPVDKTTMISSFESLPYTYLNPVYFTFDTTGIYQVITVP